MSEAISYEAVRAKAARIVRWGIEEAREHGAMEDEAVNLAIEYLDPDIDPVMDDRLDDIIARIENAIDDLVLAEAR